MALDSIPFSKLNKYTRIFTLTYISILFILCLNITDEILKEEIPMFHLHGDADTILISGLLAAIGLLMHLPFIFYVLTTKRVRFMQNMFVCVLVLLFMVGNVFTITDFAYYHHTLDIPMNQYAIILTSMIEYSAIVISSYLLFCVLLPTIKSLMEELERHGKHNNS